MKAFFLALLASLVWALAPSIFKLVVKEGVPPSVILIFHNLSAFITAVFITAILGESPWVNPTYLMFAFIGGFLSGFLGLYLFFLALRHGDVSIVSPVASISPFWSAMFAHVLLGEPLNWSKIAGIVLIIIGVSLLSLPFQK